MCSAAFVLACLACMHNALGVNTRTQGSLEQDAKNTLSALLLAMTSQSTVRGYSAVARKPPARMVDEAQLKQFLDEIEASADIRKLVELDDKVLQAGDEDEEEYKRAVEEYKSALESTKELDDIFEDTEVARDLEALLEDKQMFQLDGEDLLTDAFHEKAEKLFDASVSKNWRDYFIKKNMSETPETDDTEADTSVKAIAHIYHNETLSEEEKKLLIFAALVGEGGLNSLMKNDSSSKNSFAGATDPFSDFFADAKEEQKILEGYYKEVADKNRTDLKMRQEEYRNQAKSAFAKYYKQVSENIEEMVPTLPEGTEDIEEPTLPEGAEGEVSMASLLDKAGFPDLGFVWNETASSYEKASVLGLVAQLKLEDPAIKSALDKELDKIRKDLEAAEGKMY